MTGRVIFKSTIWSKAGECFEASMRDAGCIVLEVLDEGEPIG